MLIIGDDLSYRDARALFSWWHGWKGHYAYMTAYIKPHRSGSNSVRYTIVWDKEVFRGRNQIEVPLDAQRD